MPFRLDWLHPIVGRREIKPHPLLRRRNAAIFSGEGGKERSIETRSPEDVQYHKEKSEAKLVGNLPPKPTKEHEPIP